MNREKTHNAPRRDNRKFWKFLFITIVIAAVMLVIAGRLFSIQVLDSAKYREKAKRQHESRIELPAERGGIYDRNGNKLAVNIKKISVAVDPTVLKNKDKICSVIARRLNLSKNTLLSRIKNAKDEFVYLVRGIDKDRLIDLYEINDNGLIIIPESRRYYPYGDAAAQITGCTDVDNKGLTGLELSMDTILSGKAGYMMMYRDGLGRLRPSPELPSMEPQNGKMVKLTLDIKLQRIVNYELGEAIRETGAENGTVIAINPGTGEILAMASYPGYNPNKLGESSGRGMKIKSISEVYEPGSTFKAVTASAAIEEGIVKESDVYSGYNGVRTFSQFTIRDVHPLGKATFREAMIHSSNIIFSEIANKIPDRRFYKYIRDFGFGISLDIDLPGEVTGNVQKPDDFYSSSKRYIGFGYGISATPLQMLCAYATIANKGELMKPYVVGSITDAEGNESYKANPVKIRRVISENTATRVSKLITSVVDSGSGRGARIPGFQIAGKTGTTQQIIEGKYSKSAYTASFAGFFPADYPQVAMIVVLNKPKSAYYGGAVAAPVFKKIVLAWLSLNPMNDAVRPGGKNTIPDFKGFSREEAEAMAKISGFTLSFTGKGDVITGQDEKPGVKLNKGRRINLSLQDVSSPEKVTKIKLSGWDKSSALKLLSRSGLEIKTYGKGMVQSAVFSFDTTGYTCTLICN